MKDRLIELVKNAHNEQQYLTSDKSINAIAEYLIEDGVIALPINAGDTIYRPFGVKGVESWEVTTIVLYPEEIIFIDDSENSFKESDIVVSVFLTREEAEKALQGVNVK